MRHSPFLAAALLAFTFVGAGGALAFDQQTLGGFSADGSGYVDLGPTKEESTGSTHAAPTSTYGGLTITPGAQFNKSTGASGSSSYIAPSDLGWQNLKPGGRLTR